jgi:hypothetical protein
MSKRPTNHAGKAVGNFTQDVQPTWFYCRTNIETRGNTKCPAASSITLI